MRRVPEDLASLERWMRRVLTDPAGPEAALGAEGFEAADVVARLPGLGPLDSLRIYSSGYFERIAGCLRSDFPALAHAVGDEAFGGLCRAYLAEHPSRHYNIAHAGERMTEFTAGREGLAHREFLSELARLEWTVTALFDVRAPEPLSSEALGRIPPESFAGATFEKAATAVLLDSRWPVNAYLQAVLEERCPEVPAPEPSSVLVYRNGHRVWRSGLGPAPRALLLALFEGRTLAEAVDRCIEETGSDPEAIAPRVTDWFREWVGFGVFVGIRSSSRSSCRARSRRRGGRPRTRTRTRSRSPRRSPGGGSPG